MDTAQRGRTLNLAGDNYLSTIPPWNASHRSMFLHIVLNPLPLSTKEYEEAIVHKPLLQHNEQQGYCTTNYKCSPPLIPVSKDSPKSQEALEFPEIVLSDTMSNKRRRNNEQTTITTGQLKHKMDERSRRKKSQLLTEWLEGSIPPEWVDLCKQFAFETCKATINTNKTPAKNVIVFYAVTWNRYMRASGSSQDAINMAYASDIIRTTDEQLRAEETSECPLEGKACGIKAKSQVVTSQQQKLSTP